MSGVYHPDLGWLVTDFAERVADVAHAAVISADGVPLAVSAGIPGAGVHSLGALGIGARTATGSIAGGCGS